MKLKYWKPWPGAFAAGAAGAAWARSRPGIARPASRIAATERARQRRMKGLRILKMGITMG